MERGRHRKVRPEPGRQRNCHYREKDKRNREVKEGMGHRTGQRPRLEDERTSRCQWTEY